MNPDTYLLLDERSVFGEPDLDHLLTVVGHRPPTRQETQNLKDDYDSGVIVRVNDEGVISVVGYL